MGQTPFQLVYDTEAFMPMEYIVPSLQIEVLTGMADRWTTLVGSKRVNNYSILWFTLKYFLNLDMDHTSLNSTNIKLWSNLCNYKEDIS